MKKPDGSEFTASDIVVIIGALIYLGITITALFWVISIPSSCIPFDEGLNK